VPSDDAPSGGTGPAPESPSGDKRVAATETYVEMMERLAPETRVAGRYRIVSIAGVGGMGVVYRARDEELGVDAAVKVLRRDLGSDPRIIERFRGELVSARQVSHKNVVRLHDIGEHEGTRFLTMDYVEGRSLREILENDGPLPLDRAVSIVRQVAEGLAAAHEKGIVHRDLKPGNILIDAAGTAFITDFGVARSLEKSGITRAGAIVGTPDYLSPEQVSGDPVDGRTDLYALGIVFYEMLSGKLPFSGESQAEMLAQRIAGRPRDLREAGVSAPAWVRHVLRRCLERSPARRYKSARELIEELDRAARPRGTRWKATVIAAAVLLVLAASFWSFLRQRTAPKPIPRRGAETGAPVVPRHSIAVLPLGDQTGQPTLAWAGTGIAEMLSASLSESPNLRVLDSLRVTRGVKDLRIAAGPVDEAIARQLAELWSVDTLITGTVRLAASRVRVDVSVFQIGPSGVAAARSLGSEGNGEADIFRVVASLGGELRKQLGLDASAAARAPVLQTDSVEAAKAYQEGKDQLARGDDLAAVPAFERAVTSDPRFAAALERLAETYQNLGRQEKAVGAAERAAAAAGQGESRQVYRARARLALLRGDPAEAEKVYRRLLRKYPNDTEQKLDLAAAQGAQGHNADAVATLKEVVAVDPNDPRAWFLLGKNTILMGDSSRAIKDYLVRALALQTQLGNEKGKADVLASIARAYQRLNDYPKALENYNAAWKIHNALGDEKGLAATSQRRALIHQTMGRLRDAESDLRAARLLYEKIGDRAGVADVWNSSGVLEESRGAYGSALEAYQSALKLRRGLGDERVLAQSYDNVGYIYYLQGEYDNALVYWQQALESRRRIGEKNGVVLSVLNMGFLQTAQGKWDEAVRTVVDALEKSRATGQKDAVSISLGNLGILHALRGRFSAALSSFDESLAIARETQFPAISIEFTLKKAGVLLELGRGGEANALLAEAERLVRETGNREQKGDLEVLRGNWSLARGDPAGARRAFDRALPLVAESGSRVSLLRARLGSAAALARTSGEGVTALSAVLREAESLGHAALTLEAAEALARAELARRKFSDADRVLRKSIEIGERAGWNAGLYRLYALEGTALEGLRNGAAAEEFVRSAREIAKLRENVPPDMRASFESLPVVKDVLARTGPGNGKR
jgi:tetratricopeptide (TPR) repeat protein/predicted Ser/Thr protein kinase